MKSQANFSEPSSAPPQQPQNIRGGSPKNSEPSPTSPTGNVLNSSRLAPTADVSYNSRLFKSIMKGASDFKCKHCGESFDKLDSLTKHMMIQVRFYMFFKTLKIRYKKPEWLWDPWQLSALRSKFSFAELAPQILKYSFRAILQKLMMMHKLTTTLVVSTCRENRVLICVQERRETREMGLKMEGRKKARRQKCSVV